MRPDWHPIDRIKHEVRNEGIGWVVDSFLTRQLKSMVLLVPALAAIILMPDNGMKRAIVGISFALWFAWVLCTLVVGIFYLCRWGDREYDRKGRRRLSKDYRDS
jgi:hypothetical protein